MKKSLAVSPAPGAGAKAIMSRITRRQFGALAAGAGALSVPGLWTPALAQGPAKVVIIGGGPGGATVPTV